MVVGLLGILLAFTLPSTIHYMSSSRLTGAANTITADIHYARSMASQERKTYVILWGANSYTVSRVSPAATLRTRALPTGVSCAATDTATFYPWGLTDPINITVTNERGSKLLRLASNGTVTHG